MESHELAMMLLAGPNLPVHMVIVDRENPPESGFEYTAPIVTLSLGQNQDDENEEFVLLVGERTGMG